ncbi:MAG: hypothetical protein K2L78_05710 [Muribaculaceae bacterium]|nr:hypothetical protein [Muribaculaceae bacterium]
MPFFCGDIPKSVYWLLWCILVLVAAFPAFVLNADTSFLTNGKTITDNLEKIAISLGMILVCFLFDFAYALHQMNPDAEAAKQNFIYALCSIGTSILLIILTLYYTNPIARLILFWVSFVSITSLKWISLTVDRQEVIELRKA